MTTIKTIKDSTYAVTQFQDEFGASHKLYQEILDGTIETIPHPFAKVWNDVEQLYFEYLDDEFF